MRMTGLSTLNGYTNQFTLLKASMSKAASQSLLPQYGLKMTNSALSTQATRLKAICEDTKAAAQGLRNHGDNLMSTKADGLFAKAKEKESTTEVVKEIGAFVDDYNTMVKNMNKVGGQINDTYAKQLYQNYESNKEALNAVGITAADDGTLKVDQEKLNKADIKSLEAAFGSESSFVDKALTKSIYVESNAISSQRTVGNGYNSYGGYAGNGYGSASDFNSMIGSLFKALS